jgi:hypothetical protein
MMSLWKISNKAKKGRASEKGGCIHDRDSITVAKHARRVVKF